MEEIIKGLARAFAGESQAFNKYNIYAQVAQKEGFDKISEIFKIIALNEQEHSKWFLKMLDDLKKQNMSVNYDVITVDMPVATVINTTTDNLKGAIKGEEIEYNKYYPEFAALAEQRGLIEISNRVKAIAIAEKHHKDKFQKLLNTITTGIPLSEEVFNFWVCHQCGYVAQTLEKPIKCPSCDYTDSFYQADLGNR